MHLDPERIPSQKSPALEAQHTIPMSPEKKTAKKKANVSLKDLKSKKNPKGGHKPFLSSTVDLKIG